MTMWRPKLESGKTLYLAIVDALAADIANGELKPGARLPTHRDFADEMGVSVGTVTRAFNIAERRGLVRGETGRGTYVGGGALSQFGVVEKRTHGVVDLSHTWPLYALDPDVGPALRAIARSPERAELLHYQDNAGTHRHRAAGAEWAARFGVETDADSVLVCAGVQHAMTVVLSTLANPGDWLFTEEFTYPGIKAVANVLHLRIVGLPMDRHGILPGPFESACKQKKAKILYCTPTLQNPTNGTMSIQRRRKIAKIARRYDVSIVEDDVHRLLADDPPPPLATLVPERTYFIAGLSKTVSGALRVAFLVAPPHAVNSLTRHIWATNWMVPPLTGEVVTRWIADGTADATVELKRKEASRRRDLAARILDGFKYHSAPRAYSVWLELRPPWTSVMFVEEAFRHGVAVTPMETFAATDDPKRQMIRISLSAPWDVHSLQTGLERVVKVLNDIPGVGPPMV